MKTYQLRYVSLDHLRRQLDDVSLRRVLDGSGHAGEGHSGGWITGLSNTRLFLRKPGTHRPEDVLVDHLASFPTLEMAIEDLREASGHRLLTSVMVNELSPGGVLSPHRDGLPDDDRYHLPLYTNPHAMWWDEIHGYRYMLAGEWTGPVPYCGVLHSAINNGNTKRVHVVVDFAKSNGMTV